MSQAAQAIRKKMVLDGEVLIAVSARPRREPILQQLRFRRTIPILKKRAAAYRSIVFLCKLGDNGVVWKILEFWQATR